MIDYHEELDGGQWASACDRESTAMLVSHWMGDQKSLAPTNLHWARVVMARSPYVLSIRKACTPAVGTFWDTSGHLQLTKTLSYEKYWRDRISPSPSEGSPSQKCS
jgi:hypothetical protein